MLIGKIVASVLAPTWLFWIKLTSKLLNSTLKMILNINSILNNNLLYLYFWKSSHNYQFKKIMFKNINSSIFTWKHFTLLVLHSSASSFLESLYLHSRLKSSCFTYLVTSFSIHQKPLRLQHTFNFRHLAFLLVLLGIKYENKHMRDLCLMVTEKEEKNMKKSWNEK